MTTAGVVRAEAEVYWHCTDGRRFTAEEYIRANCSTQGTGEGAVERAEWTRTAVFRSSSGVAGKGQERPFHAVSFSVSREDRITRLDEYWVTMGLAPVAEGKAHRQFHREKLNHRGRYTTAHTKTTAKWTRRGGGDSPPGGLLGIPTETVYGLGANGLNPTPGHIFAAKGRPQTTRADSAHPSADWLNATA